jgi:hypothetical protein
MICIIKRGTNPQAKVPACIGEFQKLLAELSCAIETPFPVVNKYASGGVRRRRLIAHPNAGLLPSGDAVSERRQGDLWRCAATNP